MSEFVKAQNQIVEDQMNELLLKNPNAFDVAKGMAPKIDCT